MTDAENRPVLVEQRCAGAPTILDTTELRWFVPGLLPHDLGRWFSGSTGVVEERCDTYLLDGRGDIGVKRRFRETVELKVRQSLDRRVQFGESLSGSPEVWRRWSPAGSLVDVGVGGRWIDVCKSIVKRRFSMNGTEVAFTSNSPVAGAGCDVEIAQVTVGAVQAWTFAFAAFGPPCTRRDSLLASWQGLVAETQHPESFRLHAGRSMGYPEWLALTVAPDLSGRWAHRPSARSC